MAQTTIDLLFRAQNLDEIGSGLDKSIRDQTKGISKSISGAIAKGTQIAAVDPKIASSFDTVFQKPLQKLKSNYIKALKAGNEEAVSNIQKQIDLHVRGVNEEFKVRKKAFDEMRRMQEKSQRDREKVVDKFQRGESAVGNITSAVGGGDFGGLLQNLLQGGRGALQKRQESMMERAQTAEGAGTLQGAQQAAQLSKMGSTLGKIATALGAVAAVAGAIVLLVKLFIDLDRRVKDMNKAILATASASDFGFGHAEVQAGKLASAVDRVRKETVAGALELGVKAEELQGVLTSFNEAGFTFRKMESAINDTGNTINNFADVAGTAVTQSRMMGLSIQETAQTMGQFAVDTGSSLEDISMQFSQITREAAAAGVSTKRFFQTISEATSGMAFYGVRIEETARILSNFDSLLGETVGTDLFKQLTGKGKDMGAQDRLKEIILKNPERVADAYARTFASRQSEIARDMGDDLQKVLGEGETLEDFLKLDEQAIRNRLAGVLSPQEIERITQASVLGRAGAGDMDAMQRARAFGGTGLDVRMAATATEVFDGKRIDEVFREIAAGTNREAGFAALEEATGKSFDELEKLNSMFSNAEANLARLREISAKDPGLRSEEDRAFLKAQEEMFGITLGEKGEIKRGDKLIADAVDFVAETQAKTEEELKNALTQDQKDAMQIRNIVTSIADQMDMVIAQILENIYDVVVDIYRQLLGSDTAAQTRAAQEAEFRKQELELNKAMTQGQDKLSELQEKQEAARSSGDLQQAQDLQVEIEKQTEHLNNLAKKAEINEQIQKEQANALGPKSALMIAAERGMGSVAGATRVEEALGMDDSGATLLGALSRMGRGGVQDYLTDIGADAMSVEASRRRQQQASALQGNLLQAIMGGSAADLARQDFLADDNLVKQAGGKEALLAIIEQAEKAASERAESQIGMFTSTQEATRIRTTEFRVAFEEAMKSLAIDKSLEETAKNTKENPFNNMAANVAGFFAGARKANDLILPSGGGAPIITDSADTIVASKPGGAIDRAMGATGRGGGAGSVVVNVYGGDERKVYNTVLKVLRETGNA